MLDFQEDIRVLKAAGIAVAFAAGNAGPNAATSVSPANNPDGFPVGAVNVSLNVSSFSSRGPSACAGADIYPGLTAPGEDIVTTDLSFDGTARYTSVSGTSYSSPHLAGIMALLIGAFPNAPVYALEAALKRSAHDLGAPGPDSEYGYGLVDAGMAYTALAAGDNDDDGYPLSSDCNDNDSAIHPGAAEIKHDGLDQDCNGHDLTIDVHRALYDTRRDFLWVEASSDLGAGANLRMGEYGAPMRWQAGRWVARVKRPLGDPGQVTLSGIEGSVTASTQAR
jgi:bacillopeptidase F